MLNITNLLELKQENGHSCLSIDLSSKTYFLTILADVLDYIYTKYEKVVIMGDFNCTVLNPTMVEILEKFQMTSQISIPTCYKSQQGSCIDLTLSNSKSFLFKCDAVETGVNFSKFKETNFLRYGKPLTLPQTINRRYGLEGLNFRASLIWNNLPQHIKSVDTLAKFKSDIKTSKVRTSDMIPEVTKTFQVI